MKVIKAQSKKAKQPSHDVIRLQYFRLRVALTAAIPALFK
jgi:hypothetical protein